MLRIIMQWFGRPKPLHVRWQAAREAMRASAPAMASIPNPDGAFVWTHLTPAHGGWARPRIADIIDRCL